MSFRVIPDGLAFPESPRWHNGELWFSDVHAHGVSGRIIDQPSERQKAMIDLLERLPAEERKQLRAGPQPAWVTPMLATLTHEHFSDPDWLFEPKLDGVRCLAFRKGHSVRLLSRNRKELGDEYPELAAALEQQEDQDFIADGEVVAFKGQVTSFSQLQQRIHVRHPFGRPP